MCPVYRLFKKEMTVSLIKCENYCFDEVKKSIRAGLEPFGGIRHFVRPGQRVALKPNLLRPADANSAVITHPSVVKAVGEIVLEAGGRPFVIDSPGAGMPYSPKFLKRLYQKCDYFNMNHAIELNFNCEFKSVSFSEGRLLKRFEVLTPLLEADVIINLPKVKTHGFTFLSCAVKNLFGIVPGLYKSAYHGRFQDNHSFGTMLIDLCTFLKPSLTICDGIVGMEGDGPSWGKKKALKLIAVSSSPFILDLLISYLIGINILEIPYMMEAIREGICPEHISDVSVISEHDLENLRVFFESPVTLSHKRLTDILKEFILLKLICNFFERGLHVIPFIDRQTCQCCGICVKGCPRKAIAIVNKRARINYRKCIRCYCCHELCPYGSIHLNKSLVNRIFQSLGHFRSQKKQLN